MSFPRYAKYKDSGVEWLGRVPDHWNVTRLGAIFKQTAEEGSDDLAILSVSIHDGVSDKELDEKEMDRKVTRSDDRAKYKRVQPGDLVYNMMRAWQGGFGAVNVPGMVSPAYVVARPTSEFSTPFVEQLLRTPQAVEQMRRHSQGVTDFRLRLYWEEFKTLHIVLPPLDEQAQIAAFLDRETAKIDALVAEQRRLIELLKEKRQAVISHAVIKGLNPNAPMKPSGIEWLGDVPEHWAISSLRHFAYFRTGSTPDRETEAYWNGGIPWVKTGEINYSTITTTEETISAEGMASCSVSIAPIGTLLMALYGQGLTRGRVALLGIPATYNQACAAIQVDSRLDSRFLALFLLFSYRFIRDTGNETTQMNLNLEFVRRIRIVVPPVSEQLDISEYIQEETATLDTLTAEAQRAIDLLQERRTALISAAVTGKIDVRGLADADIDAA